MSSLIPQLPPPSDAVDAKEGDVGGVKYRVYNAKGSYQERSSPSRYLDRYWDFQSIAAATPQAQQSHSRIGRTGDTGFACRQASSGRLVELENQHV